MTWFAVIALALLGARADDPEDPILDPKQSALMKSDVRQIFILSRDDTPVYATPETTERQATSTKLGDLFFGRARKNGRVELGKYDATAEKFTSTIGWVEESLLLKSRSPIRVKDAVGFGVLGADIVAKNPTSFSDSNELDLRVVSRPEMKFEVATTPTGTPSAGSYRFTWYYVFGIERVADKSFYLVAASSNLYEEVSLEGTSEEAQGSCRRLLLGWVEKGRVKEWCSNAVLEYNTAEDAVRERYGPPDPSGMPQDAHAKPAIVRKQPRPDGKVAAREPLADFWKHLIAGGEPRGGARVDPQGTDPEIPRFHILEQNGPWYRVATLASLNGNISPTELAKRLKKLLETNEILRKVDLVFVVDGTGSMFQEIDAVRVWLLQLCDKFAKDSGKEELFTIEYRGAKETMGTAMNINVSLIVYQDIHPRSGIPGIRGSASFNTKTIFARKSLVLNRSEIEAGFNQLTRDSLGGGDEALHDGLHAALTNPEVWRPDAMVRQIIVIADEPGDLGGKTQLDVLAAMPLPPDTEIVRAIQEKRADEAAYRKANTTIYGIFTTDQADFKAFEANLKDITWVPGGGPLRGNVLFHEPEFERPGFQNEITVEEKARQVKLLSDILYGRIFEAQTRVKARTRLLAEMIFKGRLDERVAVPQQPSAVLMDPSMVEAAAKFAGFNTVEEMLELTDVGFSEGFAVMQQEGHTHPTFRQRVVMTDTEVSNLQHDVMEPTARALENALKPASPIFGAGKDPQLALAEALVIAIFQVAGNPDQVAKNEDRVREARTLIAEIHKNPKVRLRDLMQLGRSLPIEDTGLLGMPGEKLLKLKVRDLSDHQLRLARRAKCLRNLLNHEAAPEDPQKIDEFAAQFPELKAPQKSWIYRHPVTQAEFVFVPLQYLP